MKKTLVFAILVLGASCLWFATPHSARAAAPDVWKVGPNCVGVANTAQHICEFVHTQLRIGADGTPFDQWNIIVVEPSTVTDVTCQTEGTNIFQYLGAIGNKKNPWAGAHYGNVGICRGWINGGNGPVTITATYQ